MLSICLFAITLTKMRSIYTLCRSGLAKDAVIILRVMFEDLTNFNYMDNDKKRIQDFIDFDPYQRMRISKWISADQRAKIDVDKLAKREKELQEQWDKVKQRFTYKDKNGNEKVFKNWSHKSLEEMAKECKGEETYNYLYRYLSTYVHLTPTTFNDYILGKEKNNVVVEIGASEQLITAVLATASILTTDALVKVVNQHYSLGLDKEIEGLAQKIKSLKE